MRSLLPVLFLLLPLVVMAEDPVIEGKKASKWLRDVKGDTLATDRAVRVLGLNPSSLHQVLLELKKEVSPARIRLQDLTNDFSKRGSHAMSERASSLLRVIKAMETNGAPAARFLSEMLARPDLAHLSSSLIYTLADIAPKDPAFNAWFDQVLASDLNHQTPLSPEKFSIANKTTLSTSSIIWSLYLSNRCNRITAFIAFARMRAPSEKGWELFHKTIETESTEVGKELLVQGTVTYQDAAKSFLTQILTNPATMTIPGRGGKPPVEVAPLSATIAARSLIEGKFSPAVHFELFEKALQSPHPSVVVDLLMDLQRAVRDRRFDPVLLAKIIPLSLTHHYEGARLNSLAIMHQGFVDWRPYKDQLEEIQKNDPDPGARRLAGLILEGNAKKGRSPP